MYFFCYLLYRCTNLYLSVKSDKYMVNKLEVRVCRIGFLVWRNIANQVYLFGLD